MDLHGGVITAEGRPGNGSTFHCFFQGDNQKENIDRNKYCELAQ